MNILNKIGSIVIIICVLLIAYLFNNKIKQDRIISDQAINIKSLELGVVSYKDKQGTIHNTVIQQRLKLTELRNSKDSATKALLADLKLAKAKIKNLQGFGSVSTDIEYIPVPQYIPIKPNMDTTINFGSEPHITNSFIIRGDTISNKLNVRNKQDILWISERQTINAPKKFFIARWIQKRHTVTKVDIKNSNPHIETIDQKFVIITK